MPKPVMLIILDGWGISQCTEGNAIKQAHTPRMDYLLRTYPHASLAASGEDVGLPEGQMGNSEVGHLNIGAGRIVYQDLTRITKAIRDGDFFRNKVLTEVMARVRERGKALHLIGLLSDGGVHSHIRHVYALLEMAKQQDLAKVYVHAFLDGRDVSPTSAMGYLADLDRKMRELGVGQIATIMGRYYAMDRDKRWDRVERAYRAMVAGEGEKVNGFTQAVEQAYARHETDEFVHPSVVVDRQGQPVAMMRDGDGVIMFNFRPDRARQITRAFVDTDFQGFVRTVHPQVHYVCFTQYDETIAAPVAFPPEYIRDTFGEVVSRAGLKQLRIAETEKYAHVTFFLNGGDEKPNPGEDRILIPSPKVATYDLKPEMSAYQITDTVVQAISENIYDVIILNYANADMVGHTGDIAAAIKGVEAVDTCLGRVVEAIETTGGAALIIGDHGNADCMLDPVTGECHTAHTSSPVPLILVSERFKHARLRSGRLADVAPTLLTLLGLEKPPAMTGENLIIGG